MTRPHFQDNAWRTATRSSEDGGACVAVNYQSTADAVGVRDSKSPAVGPLVFPAAAWAAFRATLDATSPDL